MSDVQGNVFLWTREGRPLVVGMLTRYNRKTVTVITEPRSSRPLVVTVSG